MPTYEIVRFHCPGSLMEDYVVERGLTLEEAQAHCKDPTTRETEQYSPDGGKTWRERVLWFDGYREE